MDEQWGKYRLTRKIATGGMAEVFQADLTGPSGFVKTVCLKRVKTELSGDKQFVQMFEGEARIAAGLDHPGIVQVFDFDKHDDQLFLAMEYVEGLDLRQIVQRVGETGLKLPLRFAVYVMKELLGALAYAHGRKVDGEPRPVVHRDVSPHNILVSTRGLVKLADFGIAKAMGASSPTDAGVIKGKFAYLSPEQAMGENVEPASDLFSAGLVFWEMMTGERLFRAEDEAGLIAKVVNVSVPWIPEVPDKLNQFVRRLLEKEPANRFENAETALTELREMGIPPMEPANAGNLVEQLQREKALSRSSITRLSSGTKPIEERPADSGENQVGAWAKSESAVGIPTSGSAGKRRILSATLISATIVILTILLFNAFYSPEDQETIVPLPTIQEPVAGGMEPSVNNADMAPPVARLNEQTSIALPDAGQMEDEPETAGKVPSEKIKSGSKTGIVEVNVRPWAQVTIDGVEMGTTPLKDMALAPGMHKVTLINAALGYKTTLDIRVRPGKTTTINRDIAGPTP